ncbi:hypothetical protein LEP1GSC195_0925 [Leptospira wolbachii serovar Codice str. CDC]|uniref:Uncharacterized protein n=1 Tax=Leptospira wolbachii serovar Codice str. CDC TaxID=1218599 RepID=R8ZY14_9LEPT|nr:hypothetical protein [Leptospira wolbachii]EOQ94828.1 hypothetical protein LEP1GSC195_0925 [Leptospira wolbachii serovar Codice str. CDC]
MKIYNVLLIIFLTFYTLNCFFGVGRIAHKEYVKHSFEITDKKNSFEWPKDFRNPPSYTKEDIIDKWGEPSKTGIYNNCNYIAYRDGFTWNIIGAVIFILPVPILIFPTGFDEKKIYFIDGKSFVYSQNSLQDTHFFGYFCGDRDCKLQFGKTYRYSENEAKLLKCIGPK